jgi:DNA repair exonuclease SbcCD ATPase subunit
VNIYNHQEQRASRLQEKEQQLRLDLTKMAEASAQKDLDRDSKERLQAQAEETKRMLAGVTAELARGNQQLKKMQFTMQGDQALVKRTQQLGSALEKSNLTEADATLGAVEKLLKDKPEYAEYITGPKSILPDAVVGSEIAAARQAFNKLFNVTLKLRSGAAVTQQELDRLKQEFGVGVAKKTDQVFSAVKQARDIIKKHYTSVASGYGPDVVKAYNENMRGLSGSPVLEPANAGNKVVDFGDLK